MRVGNHAEHVHGLVVLDETPAAYIGGQLVDLVAGARLVAAAGLPVRSRDRRERCGVRRRRLSAGRHALGAGSTRRPGLDDMLLAQDQPVVRHLVGDNLSVRDTEAHYVLRGRHDAAINFQHLVISHFGTPR